MSARRFIVDTAFTGEGGGERFHLDDQKDFDVTASKRVLVPAGKTVGVVLDTRTVVSQWERKQVRLHSDIEGVGWWAIDAADPKVDPDTKLFGDIFDWGWPVFKHDHNSVSYIPFAHVAGGAVTHVGRPAFQLSLWDQPEQYLSLTQYMEIHDAPGLIDGTTIISAVGHCGFLSYMNLLAVLDADGNPVPTAPPDRVDWIALYGFKADEYRNLGTDGDDLGFTQRLWIETASQIDAASLPTIQAYSYPYTESFTDPDEAALLTIPAAEGGVAVWHARDFNLCPNYRRPATSIYAGWRPSTVVGGPLVITEEPRAHALTTIDTSKFTPNVVVNGWQDIWMPKKAFTWQAPITVSTLPDKAKGKGLWKRTTMMRYRAQVGSTTQKTALLLAKVTFGPQVGKYQVLRPYGSSTDHPWLAGSKPAIGIQNPTNKDAHVQVFYGAEN